MTTPNIDIEELKDNLSKISANYYKNVVRPVSEAEWLMSNLQKMIAIYESEKNRGDDLADKLWAYVEKYGRGE